MNLIPFAILTFCVHQIVGQENVKTGDFVKSPRSLSDDRTINYKNNVQQQVTVADSADEFVIKKPTKTDKSYDDFLSFLYRNDKAKPKIKRQISSDSSNSNDLTRHKRIILFRPLFVYKQQKIRRQKVEDKKKLKKAAPPTKPRAQG